jgi:rubrerythrin
LLQIERFQRHVARRTDQNQKSLGRNIDYEIIKLAIITELDAVNLCQLASAIKNKAIRELLPEVAKEQKKHVGKIPNVAPKIS